MGSQNEAPETKNRSLLEAGSVLWDEGIVYKNRRKNCEAKGNPPDGPWEAEGPLNIDFIRSILKHSSLCKLSLEEP